DPAVAAGAGGPRHRVTRPEELDARGRRLRAALAAGLVRETALRSAIRARPRRDRRAPRTSPRHLSIAPAPHMARSASRPRRSRAAATDSRPGVPAGPGRAG